MNDHGAQTIFARSLLLISLSTAVGCQMAGGGGAPVRSRPTHYFPQAHLSSAVTSPPQAVAIQNQQFSQQPAVAASPVDSPSETQTILSEADAAEMFRRLSGKLRTDDNDAVVEADFSFSNINDEALVSIGLFPEIKELDLTGTQISDDALTALYGLPNLQSLKIKGTQISSVGMTSLTQIPTLVLLDASNTAVTDEGLQQSSQWNNLRYLSLNNTALTDAAVPYLKTVKSLKGLSLLNTDVTADGVRVLKEALPDCLIVTKPESESKPSASVVPLRPVPSQSGVAFPEFPVAADAQLEQLIELAGKQPQLGVHLASVYSNREQWHQASLVLAAAVAADPNQPAVQLALGMALARSGDSIAAKPFLTQAIGEGAADYNLGLIEYENSLRVCAVHLRQAVAADPSLEDAQLRLATIQQQLNALKHQQTPVMSVSRSSAIPEHSSPEVIPAPPVKAATFSNSWPR